MQEYDIALKLLLQGSAKTAVRELTGTVIEKWLNVELPKVQNLRLDLLGQTAKGDLVHLELQSGNDLAMPFRMLEYCLGVQRLFGAFPRQFLLYVGEAPMHMQSRLRGPGLRYQYTAIDIRTVDGDLLLNSDHLGDNVIAILARLRDHKEAIHKILERISGLERAERDVALTQLTVLAGLRRLAGDVEREAQNMPIDLDIRDHETLGPIIVRAEQQAMEKGLEKGLQKGLRKGLHQGELVVLTRVLEKRFGALPEWARKKLSALSAAQLEQLSADVLDAPSLIELLG